MIRIPTSGGYIALGEDHPTAQRIREGYDFHVNNRGTVVLEQTKGRTDKSALRRILHNKTPETITDEELRTMVFAIARCLDL